MTDEPTSVEPTIVLEDQLLDHLATPESALHLFRERMPEEWVDGDEIKQTLAFVYRYIEEHDEAPTPLIIEREIGWGDFEAPLVPVTYLYDKLKQRYQTRELRRIIKRLSRNVAVDPQEVVNDGFSSFASLKSKTASKRGVLDTHDLGSILERYEERKHHGPGVSYGFVEVNKMLGGYRKGELYFILGRPKRYKSWMLLASAVDAWMQGISTTLFTLELSKEVMLDRLGCMLSGTSWSKFVDGTLNDKEIATVKDAAEFAQSSPAKIHVVSPEIGDRTATMLCQQAQEFPDSQCVYIDQISFVQPEPEDRSQAQWYQIQTTCRILKHNSLHWPIVVAAQFNRDAANLNEMADLSKIGLSDAIGQTADMLFGLHASKEMMNSNTVEFGVIESRNYGIRPKWNIKANLKIDSSFRVLGLADDDS